MVWLAEHGPRPKVLKTGFRSRKRMFTIFFNTQGPVVIDIVPKATKLQSLPHITHLQFCQKFFCIFSQQNGLDVAIGLQSSCVTTMQLPLKLASDRRTLMTMVSVCRNIHHTHPTWLRAILGAFQNKVSPCWEAFFNDLGPC